MLKTEKFVTEIKPMAPLFEGKKAPPKQIWDFHDDSKILYPKGKDGSSMRVTLIIRELRVMNEGFDGETVFRVVKNAGKWSFKIRYRMKETWSPMKAEKFFMELKRMGGWAYSRMLVMPM